jgi:hypothetical protein
MTAIRSWLWVGSLVLALADGRASGQELGTLKIDTNPAGALIRLERVDKAPLDYRPARSPLSVSVRDGDYRVTAEWKGVSRRVSRRVVVVGGLDQSVVIALPPGVTPAGQPPPIASRETGGALRVESRPSGARALVHREGGAASERPMFEGITPLRTGPLAPGRYRVTVTVDGHRPAVGHVEVKAGAEALFAPALVAEAPWPWAWAGVAAGVLVFLIIVGWLLRSALRRRPGATSLRCPRAACQQLFHQHELVYVCLNPGCPVLQTGRHQPHRFTVDAPSRPVRCEHCGGFLFDLLCPRCHNPLPRGFRRLGRSHVIAVIGATGSGKTTFITALIENLRNRSVENPLPFELGFSFADDDSRELHETRLHEFRTNGAVEKTKHGMPQPLIVNLDVEGRGETIRIVFYDVAGETFNDDDAVARDGRYVANASGVILLVPADRQRPASPGATFHPPSDSAPPDDILNRAYDLLVEGNGTRRQLDVPLAIVISKADQLEAASRPEFTPARLGEYLSAHDDQKVIKACRAVLDQPFLSLGNLPPLAGPRFRRVGYFNTSIVVKLNGAAHEMYPTRVEQPFVWVLRTLGMLPASSWWSTLRSEAGL